jgi:hypothetical protein
MATSDELGVEKTVFDGSVVLAALIRCLPSSRVGHSV